MLRSVSLLTFVLALLLAGGCGEDSRRSGPATGTDAGPAGSPDAARDRLDAAIGGRTDGGAQDPDGGESAPGDAGDDGGSPLMGACPPAGPFGTATGEVVPEVTLLDCEGNPHSLHELCAHHAAWVFEYTDWCPPCRAFAARMESIYQAHAGDDLAAYFVVAEDASFEPANAELCAEVRTRYGLTMTVLFDSSGTYASTLGFPVNDHHLVMTRGNVVHWTGRYADDEIEARLDEAIAR
jgi:thiol-disulfide isomerase/thioredoxin